MGRLAELYSRLLHGADLSPSDEFISLILLSAAQRKTRQEHIRKAIDAHRKQQQAQHQQPQLQENLHSCGRADPPPPSHGAAQQQHHNEGDLHGQVNDSAYMSDDSSGRGKSSSLQSISPDKPESDGSSPQQAVDETLSAIQTPNAADDCDLLGKHSQGQKGAQISHQTGSGTHQRGGGHANDHVVDVGRQNSTPATSSQHEQPQEQHMSEPQEDAALRMMRHLKAMEEGKGMGASQQGRPQDQGHHPQDQGHQKIARGSLSEPAGQHELSFTERKSSRRHLNQDHFFHRDFMLAPSAFASEYDPDTAPDELADIYTGQPLHTACCVVHRKKGVNTSF